MEGTNIVGELEVSGEEESGSNVYQQINQVQKAQKIQIPTRINTSRKKTQENPAKNPLSSLFCH